MEKDRFPYFRTMLMSFGMFSSNIALSAYVIYVPLFVRRNFLAHFPNSGLINTIVGIVMVLDNIIALFVQPAVGSLSDRIWVKHLGRRMPFIIVGIPLSAFFLGLIGTFEETLIWLLIAITFFNISMAFYKSPMLALIPDFLPSSYRSEGSGVLSVVGGFASILGLFLSAYLFQIHHSLAFWVIGAIMLVCLLILILSVHEDPNKYVVSKKTAEGWSRILYNLRHEKNKALIFALIAVFLNQCGYQVAESFLSTFTVSILGFSDTHANYVLGTLGLFGVLSAVPAGLLGKKIGARDASLLGLILFGITVIPMAYFALVSPDVVANVFQLNQFQIELRFFIILLWVLVLGFSLTVISINLLVVVWDMASEDKIATYTGYYYLFVHTAAIASPLIAGVIFDILASIFPIKGLQGLFSYVGLMYVGAIVALLEVRRIQVAKELGLTPEEQELLRKRAKRRATLLLPLILFGFGARQNPVKEKRKELKQDLHLFEKRFREFMKDGDLNKKEFREAIKALKQEHKKEIRALKRELAHEEAAEEKAKTEMHQDFILFKQQFSEFMKDGDLSKAELRQAIRALKREQSKELNAFKQEMVARRKAQIKKYEDI
ncbi:MFS transporter [Candidatus Harpocratesius sp.]